MDSLTLALLVGAALDARSTERLDFLARELVARYPTDPDLEHALAVLTIRRQALVRARSTSGS